MSGGSKILAAAMLAASSAIAVPVGAASELGPDSTVRQAQRAYPQLGEAEFRQALVDAAHELQDAGYPHTLEERSGDMFVVYALPNSGELGIPMEALSDGEKVSGGVAAAGPWFEFTPLEQEMLAQGTLAGIVAGICLAPVGKPVCVIATALAAAAGAYVSERGVCPNNQRLLIEYTWRGTVRGANAGDI